MFKQGTCIEFHSSSLFIPQHHSLRFRSSDTVCYSHRLLLLPGAPSSLKHYHIFYWQTIFSQIQDLDISLWEFLSLLKNGFFILSDNNFDRWQRVEPGRLNFCEVMWCALCMRSERNTTFFLLWHEGSKIKTRQWDDTEVTVKSDGVVTVVGGVHLQLWQLATSEWHSHCFLLRGSAWSFLVIKCFSKTGVYPHKCVE